MSLPQFEVGRAVRRTARENASVGHSPGQASGGVE
jgi:hypothetical protein